MRARWAPALSTALGAVITTMLIVGSAGAASATTPVTLGSGYVLDDVDALSSSEESQAQTRLEQLKTDTGLDLWVVYVDEFTDPSNSEDWANTTAEANGLGPTQYLLAVATTSRQFYLSGDSSGPVSSEQLGTIEQQLIQPQLATEDWLGAVDAAADGLQDAAGGGSGTGSAAPGSGFPLGLVIFLVIAAVAILVIVVVVRRRRKKVGGAGPGRQVEQISVEELSRRASSALVATDDAVKTSDQELGFAKAQFGDAATVEFEQALQTARENLNRAFTIKQQLDDTTADTEEQTRVLERRDHPAVRRGERRPRREGRGLRRAAPTRTERARVARTRAGPADEGGGIHRQCRRAPAHARRQLRPRSARHRRRQPRPGAAAHPVRRRAAEAGAGRDRRGQGRRGRGQHQGGRGSGRSGRALLEDAIDKLGRDFAAGEQSAAALITELEGDIAAASALPDADGRVAVAIAATRQQVDAAKASLAGPARRPLQTLQGLEAANAQIDGVVAGVRDAAAKAQRAQQMIGQQILQAQAQVSAAEDYIVARRGAIGAEARTRLAEAGAALVQAQQLQSANPEQALQYAQRANQLAGQAIQYAQNDVSAFQGPGSSGMLGGGGSSGGGGMLGAVLGGIVINSLLGGGGGSSRGGSSGGLGGMLGGGGGGRMSPGSFGGGGTRGRRGGGRF